MVDEALFLGGLGLPTGAASLLYAHVGVGAVQRQAQETSRAARIASNRDVFDRVRELRARRLHDPAGRADGRGRFGGGRAHRARGRNGFSLIERETLETAQDIFFMRREGLIADPNWDIRVQEQL